MNSRVGRNGGVVVVVVLCAAQAFSQVSENAFETIRKRVNEVNLTFTVTDGKGHFITGLTQDNFSILDEQHPPASVHRFQSLTELPLRICVAIDASDSITNYLNFQQEVAIEFQEKLSQLLLCRSSMNRALTNWLSPLPRVKSGLEWREYAQVR